MQQIRTCYMKNLWMGAVSLVLLLALTACTMSPARVAELEAATDIEMGIPQQDVYIEGEDGMLYRIHQENLTDEILAEPAYATAEFNPPDLFELSNNPRGPYTKGEALGFTFGEFVSATGSAEYVKHANGIDEAYFTFEPYF